MRAGSLARRYAKALFELGVEQNKQKPLQKQLREFAEKWAQTDVLRAALLNPSIELHERRSVLEKLASRMMWDPLTSSFMRLLLDKDRLRFIGDIADAFDELADENAGVVRATVTTLKPLKDSDRIAVEGALAKLTGKRVILSTEVDDTIIGGAITRIGSQQYDGSVRTQLQRIKESILEEV